MRKFTRTAAVAVVLTGALTAPATVAVAAAGDSAPLPKAALVIDKAGDPEVVFGKKPAVPLDIRSVEYHQGDNGALRIVVKAHDIKAKRSLYKQGFSVALYPNRAGHQYTVHHRRDGGLRVLDMTRRTSREYNIGGKFYLRPAQNKAVFVIPTRAFGNPDTVAAHAGTYLENKRNGWVKTLDFSRRGAKIDLTS